MLSVDMVRLPNLRCHYICLDHLVLGSVSHHGSIFTRGSVVELISIMELGAVLGSVSINQHNAVLCLVSLALLVSVPMSG